MEEKKIIEKNEENVKVESKKEKTNNKRYNR